ncbi:hypothetical protein BGW80DRAFT_1469032 [Lactifluus volemus]|nr:hypothetical protein BGW80DRAFT_1469032 [Lactifluus volemus]
MATLSSVLLPSTSTTTTTSEESEYCTRYRRLRTAAPAPSSPSRRTSGDAELDIDIDVTSLSSAPTTDIALDALPFLKPQAHFPDSPIIARHPRDDDDLVHNHDDEERPNSSPAAMLVHVLVTVLISFSALVTILETVPVFHSLPSGLWFGLETSLVALFTVEYVACYAATSFSWSAFFGWVGSAAQHPNLNSDPATVTIAGDGDDVMEVEDVGGAGRARDPRAPEKDN